MSTGGFPLGSTGAIAVRPTDGISFASAPAATGGIGFDMGFHVVTDRTTANQIVYVESMSDPNLVP